TARFVAGALLVGGGVVVATTNPLSVVGVEAWQAWEPAGIMAGLGLPAVMVGIFVVLPASKQVRAAAAVGASVAVLGVALFEHAYPHRWVGDPTDLTALVTLVYAAGVIATFWSLFTAVANFKTRNDPGGTVTLEIKRDGETRVVEVDREDLPDAIEAAKNTGGVGLLGDDPDGSVPTQTNRVEERTAGAVRDADATRQTDAGGGVTGPSPGTAGAKPTSDGGVTEPGVRTPADDAEVMSARADPADATDSYCGNCEHFRYVQTSRGMRPFCEFHDGVMDDMDACDDWTPNRPD
ncbi:MAG: hypothetical protein V5A37_04610, partial [Halobacteriales archaeon]